VDAGNKAIPDSWVRCDVTGILRVIVQCLSNLSDDARQGIIRNRNALPDRAEDLFLRHHPVPVLNQEPQHVKRFWFYHAHLARNCKPKIREVKHDFIESITRFG